MVKINNFEIIKETKILYEYINDILENAELDISKEELNDLLNVSNTLEKIYSDNYKKVEDKENLKTNCDCPKCQNKLIISDLINYNYLCEKWLYIKINKKYTNKKQYKFVKNIKKGLLFFCLCNIIVT